jgi:F-type H+-transporting ATPase subunit epsilon
MATLIQFDLVSPERILLSADAEMVTIPGSEGYMGVMAGHMPLITTLKPGRLDVLKNGKDDRYFIGGGFAEVSGTKLTVLADEATPFSELSAESLEQHIRDAEADLAVAQSESDRTVAIKRLDDLRMVRSAL